MKELKGDSLRRRDRATIEVPEGQVRVLESHHAADFRKPLGTWPFHKICWVAVGKGSLQSAREAHPIRADDFLLLPTGWAHRFVDDPKEPLTLVVLCISGKFLAGDRNTQLSQLWADTLQKGPPGRPFRARTALHRSNLVDAFRLALREQGNRHPGWETVLQVVAGQVIVNLARNYCEPAGLHVDSSLRAVEGAIEFIDSHVQEKLTIDRMASRSRLSPRRFTTLFKQRTGLTFSDYLNRKRIEYACRRLDETGHILYACHSAGFNDVAYFYRVFRKLTGMTPGEYLKKQVSGAQSSPLPPMNL